MNLSIFLKSFLSIAIILTFSSCALKINPPPIPYDSPTIENPIMDKTYSKPAINLEDKINKQSKINKIDDWGELEDFFENNAFINVSNPSNPQTNFIKPISVQKTTINRLAKASKLITKTEEVNRADTLKTDGRYIYALKDTSIFILDAYPGTSAKLLSSIKFKNKPSGFFIADNRLVVFGNDSLTSHSPAQDENYSYFKIFDTNNKSKPKELRHLDIEGDYLDARLVGDYVSFITSIQPAIHVKENLVLPKILDNNKTLFCEFRSECPLPDIYYFDRTYNNYSFVNIAFVNIQDTKKDIKREFYILPDSGNFFVSNDKLYLSYEKYLSNYQIETDVMVDLLYPEISEVNKQKIKSISLAENFLLNEHEKQDKIKVILGRYINSLKIQEQQNLRQNIEKKILEKHRDLADNLEKTVIYRISLNQEKVDHQISGEIDGYLLSQLLINEKDKNLFIIAKQESRSVVNFYALDEKLRLLGKLESPAKGREIYSMHLVQNRAYLDISTKIDSLLVLDLTKPKNLKILGDLKIPQFAEQLYPYNDNFLIELGKNATGGIQLVLSDISNLQNPKEISSQILGGAESDSIALKNSNSFIFSPDKKLLAFPVLIKNSEKGIFGTQDFNGLVLFDINEQGFSLKGLIDYDEITSPDAQIKRGLYVKDTIYTFSDYGLSSGSLKDFRSLKSFSLIASPEDVKDSYIITTY